MKNLLLFSILAISSLPVLAQGYVDVITDPEVNRLEEARSERRKLNNGKVHGYRIMVAFYSSRTEANDKLSEVRSYFGESYGAVVLYDEPNFKVYTGEFISHTDAEAALPDIRKKYPGARIVSDLINAPRVH